MKLSYIKLYLSIVTFIGLGIFFPITVLDGAMHPNMLIFYAITLYSAFRLSRVIYNENIKILEVTFYIFVYIFFGIAALSQVYMQEFPWTGRYYEADLIMRAGFLIIIGIIFYELGLFWRKNKADKLEVPKPRKVNLRFISFVGVSLCLVAVFLRGGIQNLFLPRNELTTALEILGYETTSSLILTILIRVPILVAFLFALLTYLDKSNKNIFLKSNFPLILLILLLGTLTLVTNNPISTSRYWVGTVYLSVIFTLVKWTRMTQPIMALFILSILLFVFPYADLFRNTLDVNLYIAPFAEIMSGKGDYDSFQQVMNVMEYVSYYGITLGMQFLGVLFFWIPRSIWPEKPLGTGLTVSEDLGFTFTNVSAPLWSEFYINFGLVGVIILFVLYGYMSARLQIHYALARKLKGINFYRIFVPIFAAYQIFLLRGDLLSSFSFLAPVFIFIAMGLSFKAAKEPKVKKSFE